MTTIDTSASTGGIYTSSTQTRTPNQTMDGQMFLQLLVAQLKSQDPSTPMDSNAMIGQMSQLASMEQLTSLNTASTENFALQMRIAAAGFVGKTVSYTDSTGATQSGVATAVSYAGSVPTVTIGSATVALDAISGVTSSAS
jgi:flagellar basal-body rod modification protein FlgD